MDIVNSILDVVLFALLILGQYVSDKKIKQLNVENDFIYSTIEQLEKRVIQNEKGGK
jgi:hypothetical protein